VRYQQITDFLVPVLVIAFVLQVPLVHFMGIIEHPAFLIIPTSAPTLLMQGAFVQLTAWEWVYALTYTAALIIGLTIWAYRAFNTHIIMKVG
jgi:fluoroquinolone transport system permease protein